MRKNKLKIWALINKGFAIFIILFAMTGYPGFSKELPDAPNGFSWKQAEKIEAFFLLPDGWHFMEEQKQDTKAVFITKEKILEGKDFKTGLSVNVIQHSDKKTGLAPSQTAKNFIDNMQSLTVNSEISEYHQEGFSGYRGLFRAENIDAGTIILFCLALGNDETGTLYIILFESPQPEWDKNWETGSIIMDKIVLEAKF